MSLLRAVLLDAGSMGLKDLHWQHLQDAFDPLVVHDHSPAETVRARIADAEVVLVNKVSLNAEHFACAPRLRQIIVLATGTNNVDLAAARKAGIAVCNNRDYSTASVAEHTVMLMLALARRLPDYLGQVRDGHWQRSPQFSLLDPAIAELSGKTLGVVGLGASGLRVATVAGALGMTVVALESFVGHTTGKIPRLPLGALLGQSDVVSIHCPLTDATRGLLHRGNLKTMKRGALLINTARGGIVVEEDLALALDSGWIAGAGVDVLTREPPVQGNPLLNCTHPNLIITPHNAWGSVSSRQALVDQAVEIAQAFQRGNIVNCVNP